MDFAAEPEITLDYEKFRSVVHFICAECEDPDFLGKTKLHKILYYSDMLTYVATGRPLTGVDYLKQPFGPTARHLGKALRDLEASGALKIESKTYFGLSKVDFVSIKPPDSNMMSNEEKSLIREVIDFVCRHTAKEISEISHAAPWEAAKPGQRIPYFTAFWLLPDSGLSDDSREAVRREIKALGDRV